MTSKKWFVILLSLTLAVVIFFGGMTYFLDPLLQYGNERGPLTSREYTEMYSNPGIAKNYDYNAVFVGSSMVENANVSELDELFGCKTIKVPYSGGSSYNHKHILDVCYNSGHKIDYVFWALDEYALTTDYMTPRYPLPEYLYDEDKTNDLSYLLNLDIFYFYTMKDLFNTVKGNRKIMMEDGSWVEDESVYCKKNALASFAYPMEEKESRGELLYAENLRNNLDYNILSLIDSHPETTFVFYMVPYSISYWYMERQKGLMDADFYNVKTALGEILSRENTEVHFFQNEEDIITNLDNYKDYTHFKPSLNSWMSKEIDKKSHLLNRNDYENTLNQFYKYVSQFDYDGFYYQQY